MVYMSIHNKIKLIILEDDVFAAYLVHHCSRMLGHYKILVVVSYIPRIEMRHFGTKFDYRRIKETLQRWEFFMCMVTIDIPFPNDEG